METNRYVVNEKLPKEIEAKMAIVADLSKVADVTAIDKNDIAELQQKVGAFKEFLFTLYLFPYLFTYLFVCFPYTLVLYLLFNYLLPSLFI